MYKKNVFVKGLIVGTKVAHTDQLIRGVVFGHEYETRL